MKKHNVFKLNIIAASIVIGFSFHAIAEDGVLPGAGISPGEGVAASEGTAPGAGGVPGAGVVPGAAESHSDSSHSEAASPESAGEKPTTESEDKPAIVSSPDEAASSSEEVKPVAEEGRSEGSVSTEGKSEEDKSEGSETVAEEGRSEEVASEVSRSEGSVSTEGKSDEGEAVAEEGKSEEGETVAEEGKSDEGASADGSETVVSEVSPGNPGTGDTGSVSPGAGVAEGEVAEAIVAPSAGVANAGESPSASRDTSAESAAKPAPTMANSTTATLAETDQATFTASLAAAFTSTDTNSAVKKYATALQGVKDAKTAYSAALALPETDKDKAKTVAEKLTALTAAQTKLTTETTSYQAAVNKVITDANTGITRLKTAYTSATTDADKAKALQALIGGYKAVAPYEVQAETTLVKLAQADLTDKTRALLIAEQKLKTNADKEQTETLQAAVTAAKSGVADAKGSIANARNKVVRKLDALANLIPLANTTPSEDKKPSEAEQFRKAYNEGLATIADIGNAADQASSANKAFATHYIGNLPHTPHKDDAPDVYNNTFGNPALLVTRDKNGNVLDVNRDIKPEDVYTGSAADPMQYTALSISAPALAPADGSDNLLKIGGSSSNPMNIYTSFSAGLNVYNDENGNSYLAEAPKDSTKDKLVRTGDGAAVTLAGNLKTAALPLDVHGAVIADAKPVRGADIIELHDASIANSLTSSDIAHSINARRDAVYASEATALKAYNDATAAAKASTDEKLKQAAENAQAVYTHAVQARKYFDTAFNNNALAPEAKLIGMHIAGSTVSAYADPDGKPVVTKSDLANIKLNNINLSVANDSTHANSTATAIQLAGSGNNLLLTNSTISARHIARRGLNNSGNDGVLLNIAGLHNSVTVSGSKLTGDIIGNKDANVTNANTVTLSNGSDFTGHVIFDGVTSGVTPAGLQFTVDNSRWTGVAGTNSPDVTLTNGSTWNARRVTSKNSGNTDHSSVNSLTLNGANTLNLVSDIASATRLVIDSDLTADDTGLTTVNIGGYKPNGGNLSSPDNYQFASLNVLHLASGGQYQLLLENAGAEPVVVNNKLATASPGGTYAPYSFVSYATQESRGAKDTADNPVFTSSTADFISRTPAAELGVYQYSAQAIADTATNRTSIYFARNGKLSNSAVTVASMAAAPSDVAKMTDEALAKHLNAARRGNGSGVWASYLGGENRNTLRSGEEYKLKTNGIQLGIDKMQDNWLAGVAFTTARANLNVMNSTGKLNSYGAQFYVSRRYENNLFIDGIAQFDHFSNTAKARLPDGGRGNADFAGNGYGLGVKLGYAYQNAGFFAEPYLKASGRAFDGASYQLSNGLNVSNSDYKSVLGEIGADLGYTVGLNQGYLKPYLHLAVQNEFANGNSVNVNNINLNNSVNGAAFRVGAGAEVKLMKNIGGYAAFDYAKGSKQERPYQINLGVNYNW